MSVTPAASQMRVPLGTLAATLIAATLRPGRRSIRHPADRFRSAASRPKQASAARCSRHLTTYYEPLAAHAAQQRSSPVETLLSARRHERASLVRHLASRHDRALAIDRVCAVIETGPPCGNRNAPTRGGWFRLPDSNDLWSVRSSEVVC